MKHLDLIKRIEWHADAARKTVRGPDYDAIIRDVAARAGVPVQELDAAYTDWIAAMGTTG